MRDLYGDARLARHARELAHVQDLAERGATSARNRRHGLLLSRLAETERVLADVRDVLLDAAARGIDVRDADGYRAAAEAINVSGADAVWLQHEFGIFGGPAGDMVLGLVDRVAAPLIVTERRSGKAKSHSASPFTMPVIGASPGGGAILKCALTMARKLRGAGRSGTRLTATTGGTARTT